MSLFRTYSLTSALVPGAKMLDLGALGDGHRGVYRTAEMSGENRLAPVSGPRARITLTTRRAFGSADHMLVRGLATPPPGPPTARPSLRCMFRLPEPPRLASRTCWRVARGSLRPSSYVRFGSS